METGNPLLQHRSRGVLTIGIAAMLLSATGQPTPKLLNQLTGMGLPDIAARLTAHAIPVLLILAAVLIGRVFGKGRSRTVRWVLYGLLGGVAGFFTAFCLDLLVGVPAAIEALIGPMAEPEAVEIALWGLGGITIVMGLMVAAIAAFGPPAAFAMNLETDIDPESLDIRKPERAAYALSSVGLVAMGVASVALAVARLAADGAAMGPSIVALVAGAVSVVLNIVVWKGLDELQRRQVISGFSVSAVFVTLAAFVWAIGEAMGWLPSADAAATFVVISFLQFLAMTLVTAASVGNAQPMGRAA